MQAGGGLVEDVEGAAGLGLGKRAGELDALGFAAGERGGGLAELDVAEADFDEGGEFLLNLRNLVEQLQGFGGRKVQDVGNGMALETHGQRLGIVAAAAADFAGDVNIGKKIHFDAAETIALAGFAAASFDVEAEAAGTVAALARFGEHGEQLANGGENAGVGGRVGARGAADGSLVDLDDFVDLIGADDFAVRAGRLLGAIEFLGEGAIEDVVDEGGFAGAGNAGDDREQAEGQSDVDIFQIVGAGAENLDGFAVGTAALFGDGDVGGAAEIAAGERFGAGGDVGRLAVRDKVTAGIARSWAEVDDEVGAANGVFIVFDDEHGVAEIAKLLEGAEQASVVAGVQADGRLVENVQDAAEARADLRGEADAMGFAAGERGGGTAEAEIAEADGEKKIEALGDFLERAAGDFALARGEVGKNFVDGGARGGKRERREIGDGPAGELHGERFGTQALAVADAAQRGRHVLGHPLAIGIGIGFLEVALEEFEDAVEAEPFFGEDLFAGGVRHGRRGGAAVGGRPTVQDQGLHARRLFLESNLQVKAVGISAKLERPLEKGRTGAGAEAAVEERASPVRDDARGIEIVFGAEAIACGARAIGRVEAEGARLKLRDGNAAIGASELFGEDVVPAADDGDGDEAGGELEGGGDGLLEARSDARLDEQTVDDDFDGVVLAVVGGGRGG